MKKKLMAAALAVCVVALAATGASLAYFTDKTETANNVFTMGNVKIALDETDLSPRAEEGARTSEGNVYSNLYPGMEMVKDPIVHNTGKNPAWVRVIVRVANGGNFMEQFEGEQYQFCLEALTHGLGEGWSIDDYDYEFTDTGDRDLVYTIDYLKILAPGESTTPVFEKLYIPASFDNDQMAAITTYDDNGEPTGAFSISIHAEAIQSDALGVDDCLDAFLNWEE